MNAICVRCTARPCDITSRECLMTPREIMLYRPELLGVLSKHQEYYRRTKGDNVEPKRQAAAGRSRKYRKANRPRRLETERRYRDINRDLINAKRRQKRATRCQTN